MTRPYGRHPLGVTVFLAAAALVWLTAATAPRHSSAQGRIHIDIRDPFAKKYPVAVAPFKSLGNFSQVALATHLRQIVADDLAFVGFFRLLPRTSFTENPATAGLTADRTDWQSWKSIGAQFLIKGGYNLVGDQLTVELRLFDVLSQRLIIGQRYVGARADERRMIHRFADRAMKALFGEWSVFSTRIAYISGGRIMVADFDGHNPRGVSRVGGVEDLSWSPDGKGLAFTRLTDWGTRIYVQGSAGGAPRRVTGRVNGISTTPVFSPKGGSLAATLSFPGGEADIYLLSTGGRVLKRLTRWRGIDVSPAFSPDGGRIAFASDRAGGRQVFVMGLSGGARRLTYSGNQNTDPAWSPRGDLIAYVGRGGGGATIYTVRPDGQGVKVLGPGDNPSFSPDGRMIIYARGGRLWVMNADGSNQRPLKGLAGRYPRWSPRLNWQSR
ncbi:MAG: Tol-Pal system beta propeller repeat protein TolB [Proteobacteria bacterium]|nr:Tol-Pal system beta propeller repeat protein TolB [Pseudomonadota bacterium]